MLDSKRMKVVIGNICCFLVIFTVIYQGQKYDIIDGIPEEIADNIDVEINENVREMSEFKSAIRNQAGPLSQEYQRKLCELDRPSIQKLKAYNTTVKRTFNTKKVVDYVNNFFHEFVQNPHRSYCKEMKRFGGGYNSACKFTDGSKFVCMDELLLDIENGECLIYSFGVAEDWTFEDIMDELGCEVYAFDGSVDFPERRGQNIHFEKVWVSFEDVNKPNQPIEKSLPTLLAKYGHTKRKISYLKMDIEGNERRGLPHWLHDGALDNVQQIGLEFHLDNDIVKTNSFIQALRYLYLKGHYRLISYEANGCAKNTETNIERNSYFNLAEIVLKKVTDNDICI